MEVSLRNAERQRNLKAPVCLSFTSVSLEMPGREGGRVGEGVCTVVWNMCGLEMMKGSLERIKGDYDIVLHTGKVLSDEEGVWGERRV